MTRTEALEIPHGVQVVGSSNLHAPTTPGHSSTYRLLFMESCRFQSVIAVAESRCSKIPCRLQTRVNTRFAGDGWFRHGVRLTTCCLQVVDALFVNFQCAETQSGFAKQGDQLHLPAAGD